LAERFRGRVVIVTGAGSGIGRTTAEAFGREGAAVVVNDRSEAGARPTVDAIVAAGGRAVAACGDVSQDQDCRRIVSRTVESFGGLDILINNAGVGASGTVLTTDEATWDRLMRVNLRSVFLMSRAALEVMVPRKAGVIVNAGSIAGVAGIADRAAYVASKFGVVGLTRAMALDHVGEGIRVNCVCPGTTDTPWIQERLKEAPDPEAALASLVARQPMRRLGTAEEMAAAYLFLASDESSFTTGASLIVDGGFSA
jgi:NAD(P)-dependent dehydrogenase (short-subunit alcohol dehydrogenase family)